jgi:hypothetical protein
VILEVDAAEAIPVELVAICIVMFFESVEFGINVRGWVRLRGCIRYLQDLGRRRV